MILGEGRKRRESKPSGPRKTKEFLPQDSQWEYKNLNKPKWHWLTMDDLEMTLENITFWAGPSFNQIFFSILDANEKSDFEQGTIEYICK